MTSIPIPEAVERSINDSAESLIGVTGAQEICRHHRRKCQCYHAGNENRAGKGQREFAKERARQSTLKSDRRINGRQRDRHRDDWPDQFARADEGGIHARHAFAQMSLDVFDYDDGIIDDQSDRKHDRQQRKQVQREAEHLHEKQCADKRNWNRDDRNEDRAERT